MCVPGPVLVPAEAGDGAVGGALVLDLDHRPLAGLVRAIEPLGDDAVEAGALEPVEPVQAPVRDRSSRASGGPVASLGPRGRPPGGPAARPAGRPAGPRRRARGGPRRRTRPATAPRACARATPRGGCGGGAPRTGAPPSAAITTSPSTTHRSGSEARSGAASSGKYRSSGFRSRDWIRVSSRSRKTSARKPSHLGSKSQPSPSGSASAALASIGSIGGSNGSRIAPR